HVPVTVPPDGGGDRPAGAAGAFVGGAGEQVPVAQPPQDRRTVGQVVPARHLVGGEEAAAQRLGHVGVGPGDGDDQVGHVPQRAAGAAVLLSDADQRDPLLGERPDLVERVLAVEFTLTGFRAQPFQDRGDGGANAVDGVARGRGHLGGTLGTGGGHAGTSTSSGRPSAARRVEGGALAFAGRGASERSTAATVSAPPVGTSSNPSSRCSPAQARRSPPTAAAGSSAATSIRPSSATSFRV